MKEMAPGCSRPSTSTENVEVTELVEVELEKEKMSMIKVGKPAPVFTAPAYHKGTFGMVNLEDYKGQWILLCFYPGDFTFV
jgi:peroxiredoxin (alkyl hydroperoxide reductase subunit C)